MAVGSFDAERFRRETVTQGASTGQAKLCGLPGEGTLQVWRGQKHDVLEVLGTWRVEEDQDVLAKLRRCLAESQPVTFEGPLDDPGQPGERRIDTRVVISSIGVYRHPGQGDRNFCFVNFAPEDPDRLS